jgi:hypothetical protein
MILSLGSLHSVEDSEPQNWDSKKGHSAWVAIKNRSRWAEAGRRMCNAQGVQAAMRGFSFSTVLGITAKQRVLSQVPREVVGRTWNIGSYTLETFCSKWQTFNIKTSESSSLLVEKGWRSYPSHLYLLIQ